MPPMGLGIKNFIPQIDPFDSLPGFLADWRADTYLTIGSLGSTSGWDTKDYSSASPYLMQGKNNSLGTVPGWLNGHPAVAINSGTTLGLSVPQYPFTMNFGSNIPLTLSGTGLTIYMVMLFTDYYVGGFGANAPLIQIGANDTTHSFKFKVSCQASSYAIQIVDYDAASSTGYTTAYTAPQSMFIASGGGTGAPGLLVIQTNRNTGHEFIWQGSSLSGSSSNTGTVPNFTTGQPDSSLYVSGEMVTGTGGFPYSDYTIGTQIGEVVVFNAYHSSSNIADVVGLLQSFWGNTIM